MIEATSESWEGRLRAVASSTVYPHTPDLWPSVRARLSPGEAVRPRPRPRWAAVVAVLVLTLFVGLLATPEARAAVYRVLQVGVVRIFLGPATPTTPAATPSMTRTPAATPVLRPPLDLRGLMSLSQAEEVLGFPIPLPAYPPTLGGPDLVFSQWIEGPLAILVWLDPDDPTKARLALHVLGPETFAGKSETRLIQETQVNGAEALWLEGSHYLLIRNGSMEFRSLVTGNVLLWSEDEVTFRLETDQPLEEAVRIAESMR